MLFLSLNETLYLGIHKLIDNILIAHSFIVADALFSSIHCRPLICCHTQGVPGINSVIQGRK